MRIDEEVESVLLTEGSIKKLYLDASFDAVSYTAQHHVHDQR